MPENCIGIARYKEMGKVVVMWLVSFCQGTWWRLLNSFSCLTKTPHLGCQPFLVMLATGISLAPRNDIICLSTDSSPREIALDTCMYF